MNARALQVLGALAWGAMVGLSLVWWAPTLLLVMARWQAGWVRFEVVMGLGRGLVALGWPEVAAWIYAAEAARTERSLRAIWAERRG